MTAAAGRFFEDFRIGRTPRHATPRRLNVGGASLRWVAAKNRPRADFPYREAGGFEPSVVLDFDVWLLMPR
jgi:hypothetical protein